ncbi:MAG: hypothetical protein HN837_08950 [Chloroflexi bacterium]|jgi:hypothetical protein|nr:hypothetical protein [Chloroflexota bacterium]MBT7290597.1 hypothetical protein [Chloroflexota bacterium]
MTAQVQDKPTKASGDNYWESPFSADESINRIHVFESKKLDAQVKCGLELWRAYLCLKHGTLYPYLFKCGFTISTARNRKERAKKFLVWAGILHEPEKINEEHVRQGLEKAYNKSLSFNDFREHCLDYDALRDSLSKSSNDKVFETRPPENLLGFDLKIISVKIKNVMDHFHTWTRQERQEVIDKLNMTINRFHVLAQDCENCITDIQAWREFQGMSSDEPHIS